MANTKLYISNGYTLRMCRMCRSMRERHRYSQDPEMRKQRQEKSRDYRLRIALTKEAAE